MNRLIRSLFINNKNIIKLIANKNITTLTKPFEFIKPIVISKNLLNLTREFQSRRRFYKEEELLEEENPNELSLAPKAHQLDSNSYKGNAKFDDFNLDRELLNRLKELGYDYPFPIQAETLPHTLAGKDVIGRAITGSGKTLAFSIPIIMKILKSTDKSSNPKCLVLSPTRELCQQIKRSIQELVPKLKCVAVYGGAQVRYQMEELSKGCDIICATPGRLRDLLERRAFHKEDIELICLDEADELLTPNFLNQIEFVFDTEREKQVLMFSATINRNVNSIVSKYMNKPEFIDLTDGDESKRLPKNVKHFIAPAKRFSHPEAVDHFLKEYKSERCIVFCNRKVDATNLSFNLRKLNHKVEYLHSDHSQTKREQILRLFRKGQLKIIVATDVAARGIDIPEVDLVIQCGAPANGIEYYIHRTGRTGRAGRPGVSIVLDDGDSYRILNEIKRLTKLENIRIPEEILSKAKSGMYERPSRSSFGSNSFSGDRYGSDQRKPSYRFNNDDDDLDDTFDERNFSKNRRFDNERRFDNNRRFDNDRRFNNNRRPENDRQSRFLNDDNEETFKSKSKSLYRFKNNNDDL